VNIVRLAGEGRKGPVVGEGLGCGLEAHLERDLNTDSLHKNGAGTAKWFFGYTETPPHHPGLITGKE